MGSTLEHGIYLPSEGEKNCYSGLANNWQTVNTNIGYVTALRQAIAGALTRQVVTQLPTEDIDPNCIYMILKATAQTSNIYDEYMYINSSWELIGDSQLDLSNYYTKQEVNQLPAVASGVTSTKVGNYDTHLADSNIHVTASDKAKWNNGASQAYVVRYASVAVSDNSTVPYTELNNTDNVKANDLLLDTNGKLYQISSVDTANETVSVTTPLTQLAVDSSVVHNSGNETKSGELTVSKLISNTVQSSTGNIQVQSLGSNKSVAMYNGASAGDGGGFWAYGKDSANGSDCRMQIYNKSKSRYERVDLVNSQFLSSPSGELDCGSTSNKWKTFNGINPGALSFPDLNNGIDISGYITNFGAGTVNEYTPIADGWVSIANSGDSPIFIRVYNDYGFEQIAYSERNEVGDTTGGTYTRYGSLMIPCIKNIKIYIIVSPSSSVLVSAKFYPCLGNV